MSDRTVHGITPAGAEIVRYDRAGKWYVEGSAYRDRLSLFDAAGLASLPGGTAFLGLPGGKLFDAAVRQNRA